MSPHGSRSRTSSAHDSARCAPRWTTRGATWSTRAGSSAGGRRASSSRSGPTYCGSAVTPSASRTAPTPAPDPAGPGHRPRRRGRRPGQHLRRHGGGRRPRRCTGRGSRTSTPDTLLITGRDAPGGSDPADPGGHRRAPVRPDGRHGRAVPGGGPAGGRDRGGRGTGPRRPLAGRPGPGRWAPPGASASTPARTSAPSVTREWSSSTTGLASTGSVLRDHGRSNGVALRPRRRRHQQPAGHAAGRRPVGEAQAPGPRGHEQRREAGSAGTAAR